jgi:uncharacterized membrane protein
MADSFSNGELTSRVVALESDLRALRQVLDERDARYSQRAASQDDAVNVAMTAAEKAVAKAETATEKRLEGLNELRDMATDQAKNFARNDVITPKIAALEDMMKAQIAHGSGTKDAWAYVVGIGGMVIALLAVYFRH